jgi:aspartate/methionine/tyrosine aminotransferase
MFNNAFIDFDILKKRAYNLRWATVTNGVIPLTAADPDFKCAQEISEAICKYSKDRYFCYGSHEGSHEFKESVSNFFFQKRNLVISPNNILPIDSAAFGIYLVCKTFMKKGDEAIIFDPVDYLFRYNIELVGGVAIPFSIPASSKTTDFGQLEKLINSKTQLICLCNPLNPSGKVFTEDELIQLGTIALKHKITILSDEIWSDITFPPSHFTSIASINEEFSKKTVTVNGFSKSFGLAGLRIGYVATSNNEYYQKILENSLHQSTVHGVNVLSQIAATTALNECDYWLNNFINHLQQMRDYCVKQINSIHGLKCISPNGCYVAFVDITATKKTSEEMYQFLLNEAKVAVVPGLKQWFGEEAEGHIRICFSTSKEILEEAFSRIQKVIQ